MKIKRKVLLSAFLSSLLLMPGAFICYAQKTSGGQTASGNAGGSGAQGGGNAGQGAGQGAQGASSSGSGPASRIEATMLAYEAADRIAAHIATQVQGHTLYIYDSQSFAAIQAYDAYDATVGAFETSFNLFLLPGSSFVTTAPAVQQIASTIGSLRSTAEYSAQAVDFQTDPIIAQVANHLGNGTSVIIPKLFLLDNDLASPAAADVGTSGCADNSKTIPAQLECLLRVRNEAFKAATAIDSKTQKPVDPNKAAMFTELDKLFQVFFGTLMGTSVSLSNTPTSTPGAGTDDSSAGPAKSSPSSSSPQGQGGDQAGTVPLLSQIIQGRRLRVRLNSDSRILVLEATAAGGGSRIKHIFLAELFWPTPTPTFTGGAIVTYLLINPTTSVVEKSEVLRFVIDYGKFHGRKLETPANF